MKKKDRFLLKIVLLFILLVMNCNVIQSQNSTLTSESEIIASIRSSLLNHISEFTVNFELGAKPTADSLWDRAVAHTGVPEQGDYLSYNLRGYALVRSSVNSSGNLYTGYFTFRPDYMYTSEQEQEVKNALNTAANTINKTGTEYAKARAAFDYVTNFTIKDNNNWLDSLYENYPENYSAYAAVIEHKSSSRGLASALYRLLLMVGVDNRIVKSGNHVWNIVSIEGKWYHADAKMGNLGYNGLQVTSERNQPYYFFLRGSKSWSEITSYSYSSNLISENDYSLPLVTAITIKDSNGKSVNNKSVTINKSSYTVSASAVPSAAFQSFGWTSSDKAIASVNASGRVDFAKAGTVKITASARDGSGVKASFTLTYQPKATSIVISNGNNVTLNGKTAVTNQSTYQLKASAKPAGSLQSFRWVCSDTNTATVNSEGKVDFKKLGTVKITVKAKDGSGVKASFKLKYEPIKATKISIYNENNSLLNNKTFSTNKAVYQLKANAQPSSALQNFGWASSDTSTALVDVNGLITFRKMGTATITASARDGSGQKASFTITYKPIKTTKLSVYSPQGTIVNGKSVKTTKRIYKLSGKAQPAEALQIFSWTSGNTNIATVNVYGVVGFKKPGTVKILMGTRDGSGHKTTVTVTYAP